MNATINDKDFACKRKSSFLNYIKGFRDFGTETHPFSKKFRNAEIPIFINEFWTAKQRQGHRLHEISYRACFKSQLPKFFIDQLSSPGDVVYDPFAGRGTTCLESALIGRIPYACDANPLSAILLKPRLQPPNLQEVEERINTLNLSQAHDDDNFLAKESNTFLQDLLNFYHPKTLQQILALRAYFLQRKKTKTFDDIDAWLQMVATNRLTGHSRGFFSVYTLPPNQAVSVKSQIRINQRRNQTPDERNVTEIILKKSKALLKTITEKDKKNLHISKNAKIITGSCESTPEITNNSVQLIVTSPPFLDVVDYKQDNWLRCWFNGIDAKKVSGWQLKKPEDWQAKMTLAFKEFKRILKPGGWIAFEVGEVKKGKVELEDFAIPSAQDAGLTPICIAINSQKFTKTSQCWGVDNSTKGTNTNRIIILQKLQKTQQLLSF